MKKEKVNPYYLLETLQEELSQIYGNDFLIELQKVCGYRNGEPCAEINQFQYLSMLRGAWYSTHQKKLK